MLCNAQYYIHETKTDNNKLLRLRVFHFFSLTQSVPVRHTGYWTCHAVQLKTQRRLSWRLWLSVYRNDIWDSSGAVPNDPWPPGVRRQRYRWPSYLLPVNSWKVCSSTDRTIKLTPWRILAERQHPGAPTASSEHSWRVQAIYRVKNPPVNRKRHPDWHTAKYI